MKKALPLTLVLIGTALLITAVVFWIDSSTSAEPQSFGKTLLDWVTLTAGLGVSIKGWIDLFKKEKPTPPTTNIDVKGGNPQISTGENTRNIQTQIYIENQVIQQTPESRKTSQKDKREILESLDTNDNGQKRNNGSMIRFLDSLDSARYSHQAIYENSRLLSVLYVKAQFFLAIVTGDSIVVTENQFFDSLGFLESFDELYHAAESVGLEADLPIKVALRANNSNAFQAVANNIGNEAFVLTLWKDLEGDAKRRKLWAEQIGNGQKPNNKMVLESEQMLLDKLWTALEYFTPNRCVPADNIPTEFSKRIKRIVEMRDEDLDDLYTGISMGVQQRKYFNTKMEVDAAKEIRDMLITIQEKVGEIKTRSLIRRELLSQENQELREGVIEFTDGIYNQTLGMATRAMLIQSSTFPPRINKYVTAGYSLSTFIQDISNPFNHYVNWEIYSFDHFENLEGLDDQRRKDQLRLILEAARINAPWGKLIELQDKAAWQTSLEKFKDSLEKLQSVEKNLSIGSLTSAKRKKLESERQNTQKELNKNWMLHISNISKVTANDFWNIAPTEITLNHPSLQYSVRISYSFLKTKIDMEGDNGFKIWRSYSSFKGRLDSRLESSE